MGIGLLVSGVFLLAVATALYSSDLAPLTWIVPLACLGGFLGDQVGFHVGRWVGPRFHHSRVAARYRSSLDKGKAVIRKYGAAAVFIGRFVPAIRSLIPALLGISDFPRTRYLVLDVLACIFWSLALGALVMGLELGFFRAA